ncbi:MAG: hypothetical protein Q7R95_03120 [bacterium]|nr:hypothetical protein [bacterium]
MENQDTKSNISQPVICFNEDGSRKFCKYMLFTTAEAGVLCNNKEANYLLCHVANFKNCRFFEEDLCKNVNSETKCNN